MPFGAPDPRSGPPCVGRLLLTAGSDWLPGDVVTWNLKGVGYLQHIGVVTDRASQSGRPLIVHNIGPGPRLEDVLLKWTLTGHFRYRPPAD